MSCNVYCCVTLLISSLNVISCVFVCDAQLLNSLTQLIVTDYSVIVSVIIIDKVDELIM